MAHRVAYELAKGPIPEGLLVLHICDNPPCVEPTHLRLGTAADNNRDRDLKGRHRALPGSTNGFARLTEWRVAEIKARLARGESTYKLATEFGASQSTIWLIKAGRTWRHVSGRSVSGIHWSDTMKVRLHNTDRIVDLATSAGCTMPARVWEGTTDTGIPVVAFITRIAVRREEDQTQFVTELQEVTPPTADVAAWPARMLID